MADQDNHIEVKMLVVSGKTEDSQYFDYRPSFFGEIVRVEWDLDTMDAALRSDVADYLIKHGYAKRLSPEPEPAPIVTVEEPLVVETIDQLSSAPSVDATASTIPAEPSADNTGPEPPSQTPPAAKENSPASSGGKQRKKEKAK